MSQAEWVYVVWSVLFLVLGPFVGIGIKAMVRRPDKGGHR